MSKPASFPFLAIARYYGYDYGEVLQIADRIRLSIQGGRPANLGLDPEGPWPRRNVAITRIYDACAEFYHVQNKHIDWQTGERIDDT